ncbi:MAG: VWA domain-containing protein [Phycisphaerae bacterium]
MKCLSIGCWKRRGWRVRWSVQALGLSAGLVGVFALNAGGCVVQAIVGDVLGVTTGGQQDIASARTIIEAGGVPDPDSITVEEFLSEHDIPIEAPPDAGALFATVAAAWNDDFDALTPLATVQIGFGTNVEASAFRRRPLNLGIVIDTGDSMGDEIDTRTGTTKLESVRIAIDGLLAQLTNEDLVSIVRFSTLAETRLEAVPGDDFAAIKAAIETLTPAGGSDLARGMSSAYQAVRRHQSADRADRLIVFTDARFTIRGDRQADELIDVMETFAAMDIGATLFGVGTDIGNETAQRIAQVRGGNYFFLSDFERITTVFDEEFDLLVTPVAFDISLTVDVPFTFDVEGVYGIPADQPFPHMLELSIPTLFLSSPEGSEVMLIQLRAGSLVDFDAENTIASLSLAFTDNSGEDIVLPQLDAVLPAGLDPSTHPRYFETPSVQRGVLLLNTALVLHDASADAFPTFGVLFNRDDQQTAIDRLTAFLPYFDDLADGLEDATTATSRKLSEERALVEQLLANIFGAS